MARRYLQDPVTGNVRTVADVEVEGAASDFGPSRRFPPSAMRPPPPPLSRIEEYMEVEGGSPEPAPMSTPGPAELPVPRGGGRGRRKKRSWEENMESFGVDWPESEAPQPTRAAGPGYLADTGSLPPGTEEMTTQGPMPAGAAPTPERPGYVGALRNFAAAVPERIAEGLGSAGVRIPGLVSAPQPPARPSPGGTASDTGGAPEPPDAAKDAQDMATFVPPQKPGGIEAFQERTSRHELPEGAGQATVLSRSPGGSGEGWLQEQAGREQGPQVFDMPRPPARGGIEASRPDPASKDQEEIDAATSPGRTAIQGPMQATPDDRPRGDAWGIPEGIDRRPKPPGMQDRLLNEFQTSERQRYGQQDAIEAALEAEVAKQQATQGDPTGIGAKAAEIQATTEGQKEIIGAQAEADYGIEQKRSEAFGIRNSEIQAEFDQERARLEASEAFQDASPEEQQKDMADLQGRYDALRKQAQMETFASQDPRAIRYMQDGGYGMGSYGY